MSDRRCAIAKSDRVTIRLTISSPAIRQLHLVAHQLADALGGPQPEPIPDCLRDDHSEPKPDGYSDPFGVGSYGDVDADGNVHA